MPSVRDLARSFDEKRIRAAANDASFQRGKAYARSGAVLRVDEDPSGRGLLAAVQGNDAEPYAVRIVLDIAGVVSESCTCAFSGDGWCKHVVAVLMAARSTPSREPADGVPSDTETGRVDGAAISRRVRTIMHSLSRMRRSEAYWHVGGVMRQVAAILQEAQRAIEASRPGDALVILGAITSNYVRAWGILDDSDGFVGDFGRELAPVWTEALLSADLTAADRRSWTKKLTAWGQELESIGLDGCLDACVLAAAGWDESDELPARVADELADARLNILLRRGDDAGFLELASRRGRTLRCAQRLVELRRVGEAIAAMRGPGVPVHEVLAFAQFLREHGELDSAVTAAADALERDRSGELATWLCDVASALGRKPLARDAARIAVALRPSKIALQCLRDLVPQAAWHDERDRLLATLRAAEMPVTAGRIDVLLEMDAVADAIAVVDGLARTGYATLARVAKAAVTVEPQWAIAVATREAERIVDAAQSTAYHRAGRWLRLAADAYRHAGREQDWVLYRDALATKHRFKKKFIAELDF